MEFMVEHKIIIVGKYCVGKTCLVNRFTRQTFGGSSPYEATIGAAYTAKNVCAGSKTFRLGIWDTAGSERFESMTPLYYRGAKAAIICYDITDKTSFTKAKFYVGELKEYNPDCRLYLCGTKCDLIDSGCEEQYRDVTYDQAVKYGQTIKAMSVTETSSKTGQNVDKLFMKIAKDILEEISPGRFVESRHSFGFEEYSQSRRKTHCSGCRN